MIVKLYRGPAHGKTYEVQDGLNEINVAWTKKPPRKKATYGGWTAMGSSNHLHFSIGPNTTLASGGPVRSGQMISANTGNLYYANAAPQIMRSGTARYVKTQHTHPDGSVFFEYDQPRRKK